MTRATVDLAMIDRERAEQLLRAAATVKLDKRQYTEDEAIRACLEFCIRLGCGPDFDRIHGCGQCISCLAFWVYSQQYGDQAAEQVDTQAVQG